jgi:hypothetical protein
MSIRQSGAPTAGAYLLFDLVSLSSHHDFGCPLLCSYLATMSKDRYLRIFDPRANASAAVGTQDVTPRLSSLNVLFFAENLRSRQLQGEPRHLA